MDGGAAGGWRSGAVSEVGDAHEGSHLLQTLDLNARPPCYCFSYTAMLVNFLPLESVPVVVTVRLLPSPDTTIRPLMVISPPFFVLKPSVWSSTIVKERVSSLALPTTA